MYNYIFLNTLNMNTCNDIKQINIGTLPNKVFPKDDGKTYIYKRTNGHIYVYSLGFENHICCNDGSILNVPVRDNTSFTHLPDVNHVMFFIKDGKLSFVDSTGTTKQFNNIVTPLDWSINEW